jgi:hypothetical protein
LCDQFQIEQNLHSSGADPSPPAQDDTLRVTTLSKTLAQNRVDKALSETTKAGRKSHAFAARLIFWLFPL